MGGRSGKHLSKAEMNSLLRDTAFSGSEIREWHERFRAACPTGTMDKPTFMEIFGKHFPKGDESKFSDIIFR